MIYADNLFSIDHLIDQNSKRVVPPSQINSVIQQAHDSTGHSGSKKTFAKVRFKFSGMAFFQIDN